MEASFFLRGLLLGFSIAATVGPMCILCIQRTLHKGYLPGLVSGMGIATADAVYGSIAAFGLTVITTLLVSEQKWIRLIGGLFLIYLGIKTMLTKPAEQAAQVEATNFVSAYVSTFLLTLTNPLTILSFAAIFAGIGVGSSEDNYLGAALIVAGVFCGSASWWCILTGAISLMRKKITRTWLWWLNRVSGAILAAFGIIALVSLRW
ncbi:MAG TPA: LysE family translocator [Ktedonobacteraceae bacterium]|nr:LysE family translocator [Ktedonobacteraceae bacterium]